MKKTIAIIAALAALAAPALAQYDVSAFQVTSLNGGTNNVAATATNTYAITMDVGRQAFTGLQITTAFTGAGTGTLQLRFARSVDGVTWETNPGVIVQTAAGNGVTPVTSFAVQQVDGIRFLRLVGVANTNAVAATNIAFRWLIKR